MTKFEGQPVDLSETVPGFPELKPEVQKLLQEIATNTFEVGAELTLIQRDAVNAPLYRNAAEGIVADKLVPRVILAAQQGIGEDLIRATITQGFSVAGTIKPH